MTKRGEKIKEAFLKKYGVSHPSQLPSVKEKIKKKREDGAYDHMIENMKKTLKEKYGDENYNNREKMIQTNLERYGSKVSPITIEKTTERSRNGEIGFKSEKYKEFLNSNNINNISQLKEIKEKKKINIKNRYVNHLFFGDRLKNMVSPLFSEKDYIGNDYNIQYTFKCNKCNNIFNDTLYSGNIPRCLICYPHNRFKSKIELEISEYLKSVNVDFIQHDRKILDGNEIDIVIPDKNIGIECNGIIWHSEIFGKKNKYYHLNKSEMANKNGINIIHIWDWEWLNKQNIVKSIIFNRLGLSLKIFARKCIIKEINNDVKSLFLNENHIQGNDKSSIRLGLFFNDNLVSVMTFTKSRFDKKYNWEMSRFCTKLNTSITGGANKLFKYFINRHNPKSIVSYCDKRFFNGNVYLKIGMSFDRLTNPNYYYFNKNKCIPMNRLRFQKHKLKNILNQYNNELTEWENMQINDYDRIWDCGNIKYVWENTSENFKHSTL